jgi:hypothetical protein
VGLFFRRLDGGGRVEGLGLELLDFEGEVDLAWTDVALELCGFWLVGEEVLGVECSHT